MSRAINVPLGYDVKDRRLVVNETEAATVRTIFRRYAELGSVALLKAELGRLGIVSKRRKPFAAVFASSSRFISPTRPSVLNSGPCRKSNPHVRCSLHAR